MRIAPQRDLIAGITVGVVALPLALAFGITSGLGAAAGLITAVVAGTVAAVFGGSNLQVSGPTGAMTVVLVPIVAQYGANGVLVVGLLAGLLLIVMALAGFGRYVRFIPLPVIEGFTLGIAVIIALQQVPAALGVQAAGEQVVLVAIRAVGDWLAAPDWVPVGIAAGVAGLMIVAARLRLKPAVPVALIAVVAATIVVAVVDVDIATIGALPSSFPAPHLPAFAVADLRVLMAPAVAVAALAALESLLSATVADAMSVSQRHDPDRELFGQGLANVASPLFGGIPATAAIARTAVNVRTGAVSRLAA
ncbi:MAG TPA: SulP family inorganic anion transporter, partial [Actinomycetota bacterium]|nr:SulP family inorganic anion transporter [Actinomycetota bacterium]